MTTTTMRNVLAALVAVLALVAPAAGDETQSCSAGARFDDGAGATAVRAELDAMDHALAQAKSSLRALETLVETQGARLETMRALVATPGVTCDGSVAAAERLADAMLETRCETRCAERHDRSSAFGRPRDERPTYRDVDESSNTIVARATHSSHSSIQRGSYATDRPAVARRLDAWADHLSLTGAVRLERGAEATAMATLPQRDPERGDVPRYFAVGDSRGKTRVLRADGDVAATLPDDSDDDATDLSSPDASFAASLDAASPNAFSETRRGRAVSALAASYQRKNETVVVAGDESGRVVFYQVFESAVNDEDTERTLAGTVFASYPSLRAISPKHARGLAVPAKTANWEKERDRLVKAARRDHLAASGHLATETFDRLETSAVIEATVGVKHPQGARYAERDEPTNSDSTNSDSEPIDSEPDSDAARAIVAVAAYRLNDGKRYFAVADASGALVVFTDRGATVHSVYRLPSSDDDGLKKTDQTDHVVAFKPSRRAISWVTRSGVGSLDPATFAARRAPCAAADGARLDVAFASVAFDAAHAARFYAVTEAGETVAGVVGGVDVGTGAGVRATCALRHRNLGSTPAAAVERWNGASLASVKGYAFVALGARVSVLNATDAKRSGAPRVSRAPREVIVADVEHLAGAFGGAVGDATDCDAADFGEDAADAAAGATDETECSYGNSLSSRGARSALVATDARGAFVAVGLPGGFIAMYESALYVWKPEPVNTKLWSQPLFVAAMGAVATFQFYRSKNGSGRRFSKNVDGGAGGFGADADALRRFDQMTRASRGPDASFDPAAFRKQMERDGRWKRATRE